MKKPHTLLRCPQCSAMMAAPNSALELRHPLIKPSQFRNRSAKLMLDLPHINPSVASKWLCQPSKLCVTLLELLCLSLVLYYLFAMYSSAFNQNPLLNYPSLQLISNSISSANPTRENQILDLSWYIFNWSLSLLLCFSYWRFNDSDYVPCQVLILDLVWSSSLRTFSPVLY